MAKNPLELRSKKYLQLSSQIAQLDEVQLQSLLNNSQANQSSTGWGSSCAIDFGESKVFVKRVPVSSNTAALLR